VRTAAGTLPGTRSACGFAIRSYYHLPFAFCLVLRACRRFCLRFGMDRPNAFAHGLILGCWNVSAASSACRYAVHRHLPLPDAPLCLHRVICLLPFWVLRCLRSYLH